ncbi:hypothetical protein QFC21_007065 [Naganishia friedmannii]|uniref:Uncharacterized protein n=1 Tax=Naganishia friedmannii TaxID=89922 RepID=A0ACC2UY20_9TREE|nr:hypothetical protein QFC21_007065 [Naganishia friedmannii]
MDDASWTAFRKVEKHFKSRHAHAPEAVKVKKSQNRLLASLGFGGNGASATVGGSDYPRLKGQGVLNLSGTAEELGEDEVALAGWDVDRADRTGGRDFEEIEVEKLDDYDGEGCVSRNIKGYIIGDGLIYIPKYLSPEAQLRLMRSSLEEYTLPPNPLNLSTHYVLPPDFSLFGTYAQHPDRLVDSKAASAATGASASTPGDAFPLPFVGDRQSHQNHTCASSVAPTNTSTELRSESPTGSETTSTYTTSTRSSQRELISNIPAHEEGYEALKQKVAQWTGDMPSRKLRSKTVGQLLENELRWANLGWVYNWANKAYDFTSSHPIPFPSHLARTCQQIIRGIPWRDIYGPVTADTDKCSKFTTIIPDHWQDWRQDYKPDTGIVNFYHYKDTLMGHVDRSDLGNAAIFLCGGETRDIPPVPIILRSGDVIVMSGRSRRFYHGVPRIMEGTLPDYFKLREGDDEVMQACKRFMRSARININARQVFPVDFVHSGR